MLEDEGVGSSAGGTNSHTLFGEYVIFNNKDISIYKTHKSSSFINYSRV